MERIIQNLAKSFHEASHELYIVGGATRDELRGIEPSEFDMTTDAKPQEIKKLLQQNNPSAIYTIGQKFGTIGAFFGKTQVEITTYRSEKYVSGSRHPEIIFGNSLLEDLSRRDFTINAIAKNVNTGEIIDPFHGQQDIKNQVIKVVGQSAERFSEDPLRLLRAVRFAVTLDFQIEQETVDFIKHASPDLASISAERIAQEMDKILLVKNPSQGIRLLSELNLLPYILPEFIALQTVQHEANQHKNIYEHTLTVLDNVPSNKRLRWLALLHDIAKPQTKSVLQGEVHFLQHEAVGAKMTKNILQRLHYDNQFINNITKLVRMHLRVNLYQPSWTDGAVRRLILEVGDLLDDLITFSYADITSARQYKVDQGHKRIDDFKARVKEVLEKEELSKIKSPLTGDELIQLFNRPAGPWIKPIKEYLLNLVIDGKLSQDDKEAANKLAKKFIETQKK